MRSRSNLLAGSVARLPWRVQTKLLLAFLAIVVLLVALGAVGLYTLRGVNRRTEELIASERKIAAYRQVQHDTTSQLYSISSALLVSDERSLDGALRQLNQFGYDLERLQFVAKDEIKLLGKVHQEYARFIAVVTRVVELIRKGQVGEARAAQLTQARPLADRLERLTNELVNKAEADVVGDIEASGAAYRTSREIVIAFVLGAIALALILGRTISLSLVGPIREINARLDEIASGDFTRRVSVANRDELGALAVNINHTSEELGRLYLELEMASQHKSAFLANMSHELRTPLNAVLGYAELLVDGIYGELPERPKGVVERIQNNGKHLLALINDVLDLSKIEAGQLTLTVEDYSVAETVRGVVVATEPLATAKGLKFTTRIEDGMPTARGDARRLAQVLLNLVGNAIKFTDAGEVEIRAALESGQFVLIVRDTGPGIADADQDRIFGEFQQIDNANTRKKGGTGLGLAISKRMVEMQGGMITVEFGPGARLDLPRRTAGPCRAGIGGGGGMTKRILVVEDTEDNRRIIRDLLTSVGYELIEAVDGAEGVAMAQKERPDLILMDIQLPVIDGYEATRQIRAIPDLDKVPIIAVTSYALSGDEAKTRAAGCDGYVAKPFSPRQLLAKIREFLPRNNNILPRRTRRVREARGNILPLHCRRH